MGMSRKKDVVTAWIAVIFWMFLILSFSSDPADVSDRRSLGARLQVNTEDIS